MNEPLNHPTPSVWPEWHSKPLRLTVSEINNPFIILDQFFQCYHLPDIRACLHAWLQDALAKETIESKHHFATHREVEKLVEAAWLIHQNGVGLKDVIRISVISENEDITGPDISKK